jgi:hypothetical protein
MHWLDKFDGWKQFQNHFFDNGIHLINNLKLVPREERKKTRANLEFNATLEDISERMVTAKLHVG